MNGVWQLPTDAREKVTHSSATEEYCSCGFPAGVLKILFLKNLKRHRRTPAFFFPFKSSRIKKTSFLIYI